MEINRNVILDLLPLYLANEASDETNALVRTFLENDSDLARLASQWQQRLTAPVTAPVRPDAEVAAYHAAQKQIAIRTIGLALVITTSIIAMVALIGALFLI